MRPVRELRGLRYPDEFVVRHFFKQGLDRQPGRVLELGCGTGNNLGLFQAWDWDCVGVDRDAAALDDARYNLGQDAMLIRADLSAGLPALAGPFDALLLPNLLCYLTGQEAQTMLAAVKQLLSPGCDVFVRTRLTDDYRYGRGQVVEPDGFQLTTVETGEAGIFNRFYNRAGLINLLTETLGIADCTALAVRFDNVQGNQLICGNSDLVVWGKAA